MNTVIPGYGGELAMDIYLTLYAKDKAVMMASSPRLRDRCALAVKVKEQQISNS